MKYDFDKVIDRRGTCCMKWDGVRSRFPQNPDAFPMWVADMDFQSPQEVVDAIVERAKHPIYGYASPYNEFNEVTAEWVMKRYHWKISPDRVAFSGGGVLPALSVILNAFTTPGDKVIIQTPVYYPFGEIISNNGRFVVENQLKYDGTRYVMDLEDFEKKTADPKTKLLFLCNPHNPVSRVYTREELIELGKICKKNHIIIASDEIHADLIYRGHTHIPIGSIKDFADITLTAIAPSKTFNLAGMQGAAVIAPNPELFSAYDIQLRKNRVQNISLFGLVAYTAAYKYGEEYVEQLIDYLWDNYLFLDKYLKENTPKITVQKPEGTYLMWMDCSKLGLDAKQLDDFFVNQAQLALDNGIWFGGASSDVYMRMNIACPRALLAEGLDRLKKAYDKAGF